MKRSVEQDHHNLEIQRMGLASCRKGLRRRDEEDSEENGEENGEENSEEDGEDDCKKP
jgi:hypothetical protein